MIRSLYSGLSGLRNHETKLDVIGNNISNLNTVGFKSGRVNFEEMMATTLKSPTKPTNKLGGQNPIQVGVGSQIGSITTLFSQGGLQTTGKQTDLAIQGDGFFVLSDGKQNFYTRDGSFQFDSAGRLVTSTNGYVVQGKMANATGELPSSTVNNDIQLAYGLEVPANSTSEMTFAGNLNAAAESLGTITESATTYAIEQAGHGSDINGMYAGGVTNNAISGMSVDSTTVTISDGKAGEDPVENTYTYVQTKISEGDNTFNSLDDLITEINLDYEGSLEARLDEQGQIVFENKFTGTRVDPETGEEVTGKLQNQINLSSTNSIFKRALSSANGVIIDETAITDEFSHMANEDDLVTNLRNYNGDNLNLENGDTITINGTLGGDVIDESVLEIDEFSTYGDLIEKMNAAYQINNTDGVHVNSQTGGIKIIGDGGQKYEIAQINIHAKNSEGDSRGVFNEIFDNTPGNWLESRKASDAEHASSITVYDSLGYAHSIDVIFTKDTAVDNRWNWRAEIPEPATMASGYSGSVTFNDDGSMRNFNYDGGVTTLSFDPGTGAQNPISINLDTGESGTYNGLTQFEASSTAVITDQDGFPMGKLETVTFDEQGVVIGIFSNGETQTLAQISLAEFTNDSGMVRTGNNMYKATNNSGSPVIGDAGVNIDAVITPGALELSNVELSTEFANMITTQRGYQANARIVTTSDDILQETIRLKT